MKKQPQQCELNCSKELKRLYKKYGLTRKELEKVRQMKKKYTKIENKAKHICSICDLIANREMDRKPTGSSYW